MNFSKFGDMAKSAVGQLSNNNQAQPTPQEGQQQEGQQQEGKAEDQQQKQGSTWGDVGSSLKGFQSNQAAGKSVDYKQLGQTAQGAYSAYNKETAENRNISHIGKGIAGGFMGGSEKAKSEQPAVQAPVEQHQEQSNPPPTQ
jgi:hypothetical protein